MKTNPIQTMLQDASDHRASDAEVERVSIFERIPALDRRATARVIRIWGRRVTDWGNL